MSDVYKVLDVYNYYDGPLVFTCQGNVGGPIRYAVVDQFETKDNPNRLFKVYEPTTGNFEYVSEEEFDFSEAT